MKRKIPFILIPVLVVLIGAGAVLYNSWAGGYSFLPERNISPTPTTAPVYSGPPASSLGLQNGSLISLADNSVDGFENFIVDAANNIVLINAKVMEGDSESMDTLVPVNRIQLALDGELIVAFYDDGRPTGRTAALMTYAMTVQDGADVFLVYVEDDRVVALQEMWE